MIDTLIIKEPIKVVSVEKEMLDGRLLVKSIDFVGLCEKVDAEYTKEVVPETWKELIKLCKKMKNAKVDISKEQDTIFIIPKENCFFRIIIDICGDIYTNNYAVVAEKRTIPQLWKFIRSLM